MATNSKIEWSAHHIVNLWSGCTIFHEDSIHDYAHHLAIRRGWFYKLPTEIQNVWENLKSFQKKAQAANEIHRVFVGSMMDMIEPPMSLTENKRNKLKVTTGDLRDRFFDEIVPNSPNLIFLMLTQRPLNIKKYIPSSWKLNRPSNVMFGTAPGNQRTFDTLTTQQHKVNGQRFIFVDPEIYHNE